jgi:hypothetical protein
MVKFIEIRDNEKELMQIAENARLSLERQMGIKINNASGIPTVVYMFLLETVNFLNKQKEEGTDVEVNLMNLMTLGISHRESEDGEKEGNFTPYLQPGQELKLLVKDDEDTEE